MPNLIYFIHIAKLFQFSTIHKCFIFHVDARTKLAMQASYQKARGQQKSVKYPQPEFNLGDSFTRTSAGINDDSPYCK